MERVHFLKKKHLVLQHRQIEWEIISTGSKHVSQRVLNILSHRLPSSYFSDRYPITKSFLVISALFFLSQRELERWEHDIIQICDCFVFHGNQKGIEVRNYLIFQAWMKPIVKPVTYSRLGVWMFEEGGRP
jgi:hypothetical protein